MDAKKRYGSKLINALNIPCYSAALIACEHKAVFYKKLWGYTFYTIDNFITFKLDDTKTRFVILGLVGVSDDESLYKSFVEVMNFLGYEVNMQATLPIFDSECKKKKYKEN